MNGVNVADLTFCYNKKSILEKVFFKVEWGEVLTILGPNGSGKTTLLKCLNRLLKPKGNVFIDSFDVSKLEAREIAKNFGYVPQIHFPNFPYKVIDIVVSGRTPYMDHSIPKRKDYELAYNVLDQLRIMHLANRPYTQLSGGELRLILLARALVQNPRVLLLDEPTSHLDLKNKFLILNILIEIADKGIAVIMSEHDPNLASIFANKVLLMCEGRITSYGKPEDVLTKENLSRVYGIDVEVFKKDGHIYIFPSFRS